jgi:hypothetical protein
MADDRGPEGIHDIQCQRLNNYENNEKRIIQDAKYEESDRAEYTDRFIYELLQNAVDEMEGRSQRRVRFELADGELLTANTGRPFNISDLEALSLITDTTKGGGDEDGEETIGHKGRGFTSVLSITANPQVHSSTGLDAECSSQRTAQFLEQELPSDGRSWQGRAPTMAVPFETDRPDRINQLIKNGHETIFRLPLRDGIESEQIETALREKLRPETLACLPELEEVVVATDGEKCQYEIDRERWDGTADAQIVTVRQTDETETSPTTDEQTYIFFHQNSLEPPEQLVGISDRLLADIGQLSVSIGFPLNRMDGEYSLAPVTDDNGGPRQPPIHVFLPTEDRSPIPALLNGLFHVSNARRRLSMPEVARESDSESVNTFLFGELAALVGTEVTTFVDETDTSVATLLRCLDITISESDGDDGVGRALREEFVDRLQDELGRIEIVPRLEKTASGEVLDERGWKPPTQIVVPHTNERGTNTGSEGPDLGPLVALLYGPDEVNHPAVDGNGWFPRQSLLTPELTDILEAMGATALEPEHTPKLLHGVPDSRATLQHTEDDTHLTVDPILHAVGMTWLGLTGRDEKEAYKRACRESRVIPVGSQRTTDDGRSYYRHIAERGDVDLFLPPARSVPSKRLNSVALFPYELYYLPENSSESKRARTQYLDGSFSTLLESVLNHEPFGFNEVYNRAISPSLPGPNSAVTDELVPDDDATIVNLLLDLAKGGTRTVYDGETPLPYQYRSRTTYFNLCLLPLPIKRDRNWARAHEVYFGEEWQPDTPGEDRIENLFDVASINRAPLLAPPEAFGVNTDDEDALEEAKNFFRWLGVTGHVRVTPFFHPQERHEYRATNDINAAPGSVVDATSETTTWNGVDTIEDELWKEYRTTVEARLEERARGTESFYIWQINDLEYLDELTTAAKSDEEVARQLLSHLDEWWGHLERFADASLVLWTNKTFGPRQNRLYKDEELEKISPNLWLWQLRRASWLPTEHGSRPPGESWLLSNADAASLFSLTAGEDSRSLLPFVTDEEVREVLAHRDGLTRRLGIRQALERSSFNPADARAVTEALVSLLDNREDAIRERTQELRSTYARLGEALPGLTQSGEIDEEEWHPSETNLGEVELLCRQKDTYRFVSASEAYFVRDASAAERYRNLDVPLFVLHRDQAARFGAYFGMKDLEASIETSTNLGEIRREETEKLVDEFLEDIAPSILCRLQATRESEQMRQQDIGRLRRFLRNLQIVDSLTIEHSLRTSDENSVRHNRDVHVERAEGTLPDSIYVATDVSDVTEDKPLEALAQALSLHLEFPDWEPLYVLLQRGPEQGPLREHLRTTGAPHRPEVLEENRRVLADDRDIDGGSDAKLGPIERGDDGDEEDGPKTPDEEDEPAGGRSRSVEDSPTQTWSQKRAFVPDPEQLEQVGRGEVFDPEITNDTGGNGDGSGGSGSKSSNSIVTADYIDRIDKFGMAATMQAERDRIAEECANPERYVHDVHTSDLYCKAKSHDIAGAALERLEEETRITEPYPGFDILVVSRDEGDTPERCIELKSSSKNVQRPSITWNEWKSAKYSWLRERYYLYVARELHTGKSGESTLLQIRNPFERLRSQTRTRRTEEREIQVRLDRVNSGSDEIIERPIYWEEETD